MFLFSYPCGVWSYSLTVFFFFTALVRWYNFSHRNHRCRQTIRKQRLSDNEKPHKIPNFPSEVGYIYCSVYSCIFFPPSFFHFPSVKPPGERQSFILFARVSPTGFLLLCSTRMLVSISNEGCVPEKGSDILLCTSNSILNLHHHHHHHIPRDYLCIMCLFFY